MRIDIDDVYEDISDICFDVIDKKTDIWLEKLRENTPEDTYELQKNNKRSEVWEVWWVLQSRIYNDTEYAVFVEESSTDKKYYKAGGRRRWWSPFEQWKGVRMIEKTVSYLENN